MIVAVVSLFSRALAVGAAFAPMSDGLGPVIHCENPVADLGDVYQGEIKGATFTLENQGDAPLGLLRIVPKCGCTVAKLHLPATNEDKDIPMLLGPEPFLTLKPHEKCDVKVNFNSSGQTLSHIEKWVDVDSTDPKTPKYRLTLKINLLRVANFEPTNIQFGRIQHGDSAEASIDVWPGDGVDFDIAKISAIENIETKYEKTEQPAGKKRFHIVVRLLPSTPIGDFNKTLAIETTLAMAPIVKIPIFALVLPTVHVETGNPFNTMAVDFGVLEAGKGGEKTFEIVNGKPTVPYVPKEVKIDSPVAGSLQTTIEEVKAGERYKIHVTVDKALKQKFFKGTFKIVSDHPEAQELVVPFQGLIKQ